jgi:DNA-directed RNA polymerase subunit RPC12/RpoP
MRRRDVSEYDVTCPDCRSNIVVVSDHAPLVIDCPDCGVTGPIPASCISGPPLATRPRSPKGGKG